MSWIFNYELYLRDKYVTINWYSGVFLPRCTLSMNTGCSKEKNNSASSEGRREPGVIQRSALFITVLALSY